MRAAARERFLGIERGVDTAVDDMGPPRARQPAYVVAAQGVGRVNANADDVAWAELGGIKRLERFVRENRVAPRSAVSRPPGTYNQRGVMIATPNETSLGLTRWMRTATPPDRT